MPNIRRRFSSRSRSAAAPRKTDWARGAQRAQILAGGIANTNMLSGWETNNGYDFRGVVRAIPQGWFTVWNNITSIIDVTVAIGVLPADYNPTAVDLIDGSLKEWPWMFYRRVLLPEAISIASSTYGTTSFPTECRTARKVRQASESLRLLIGNHGTATVETSHWSNILLNS